MVETSDTRILESATMVSGVTPENGAVDGLRREASRITCDTLSAEGQIGINDSSRVINQGMNFSSPMLEVLSDVTQERIEKWLDTDSLA